jgi:hypothetical protein
MLDRRQTGGIYHSQIKIAFVESVDVTMLPWVCWSPMTLHVENVVPADGEEYISGAMLHHSCSSIDNRILAS